MGKLVRYLKIRSQKFILLQLVLIISFLAFIPKMIFYSSRLSTTVDYFLTNAYILITIIFLLTYIFISRRREQMFMQGLNFNINNLKQHLILLHASCVGVGVIFYLMVIYLYTNFTDFEYKYYIEDVLFVIVLTLVFYMLISLFNTKHKIKRMISTIVICILALVTASMNGYFSATSFVTILILFSVTIINNFHEGPNKSKFRLIFLIVFVLIYMNPIQKGLMNLEEDLKSNVLYNGVEVKTENDIKQANFGYNEDEYILEVKKSYFEQIKLKKIKLVNYPTNIVNNIGDLFNAGTDKIAIYNSSQINSDLKLGAGLQVTLPLGINEVQVVDEITENPLVLKVKQASILDHRQVKLRVDANVEGFYVLNCYNCTNETSWKVYKFMDNVFEHNFAEFFSNLMLLLLIMITAQCIVKNMTLLKYNLMEFMLIGIFINLVAILDVPELIFNKSIIFAMNILFLPMYVRILLKKRDY